MQGTNTKSLEEAEKYLYGSDFKSLRGFRDLKSLIRLASGYRIWTPDVLLSVD